MNTEQIPTVKESLQVENTTFDPDLAVRGHHIYGTYEDGSGDTCLLLERDLDLGEVLAYSPLSQDLVIFLECNVRMATRAECDAACVEYIEPPLSSEDEGDMLMVAHLNGYEAGKKNAEARIKELEVESQRLKQLFLTNMLRAYPNKTHDEIHQAIHEAVKGGG